MSIYKIADSDYNRLRAVVLAAFVYSKGDKVPYTIVEWCKVFTFILAPLNLIKHDLSKVIASTIGTDYSALIETSKGVCLQTAVCGL